ncbi:MAG: four helix bundle protein [Bacteroidota bacterium]
MRSFSELIVWQKCHQLTLKIYIITRNYPKEELYGLVSQMRRSSSSAPTNIAEGCGRNSDAEMKRFLTIASGSTSELEYQLLLSRELNYISNDTFKELSDFAIENRKMMYAFMIKLNAI